MVCSCQCVNERDEVAFFELLIRYSMRLLTFRTVMFQC
jgi:hypothetical protein